MNSRRTLLRAGAVVDAAGTWAAPGVVLLDGRRLIAAGRPESVGVPTDAVTRDLSDCVLMPGLVNAHAHLDLSHLGQQPFPGDFIAWVESVQPRRAEGDPAIAGAVQRGVDLVMTGGTVLIGDIAGVRSTVPYYALREAAESTGIAGVSYFEVFGVGDGQASAAALLQTMAERYCQEEGPVRFGLQPHAPYSCGRAVYEAAAATGLPIATHLAETLEEIAFVRDASGPLAELLQRFGVWDDSIEPTGQHPIDWLEPVLARRPVLAAHLNYVDDAHLEKLGRWPLSVAYCPRASAYFGHYGDDRFDNGPPHRYREMIDLGINVALGTDSLVCLDTPERISTLDEMRLLFRRDGTDPKILLEMATRAGAQALGFDPRSVTLRPGTPRGIISVNFDPHSIIDPVAQVLSHDAAPEWILAPAGSREIEI